MFGFKVLRWNVVFRRIYSFAPNSKDYLDLQSVIALITHKYTLTMGNTRSVIDPARLQVSVFDK